MNDGFTILMNLVGLHCQSDKARILNTAPTQFSVCVKQTKPTRKRLEN